MNQSPSLQKVFLPLLVVVISAVFGWILLPFYGAIFWALVLAILFAPLQNRLYACMPRHRNLAVLTMLLLFVIILLIPLTLIAAALVQEGTAFYQNILSGKIDFGAYFQRVIASLPNWMSHLLSRFGVTDFSTLQDVLSSAAAQGSQFIAANLLNIGQITAGFVFSGGIMLYLLFFLLRDGGVLAAKIERAIPLKSEYKRELFATFATVIRATIKGNIAVAVVQGTLGGLMFWFLGIQGSLLWGALMAVMSLIPAVGAALLWLPVAIYLIATGAMWQGISLILYGVLVIGLVDNVLRPIMVGKDTQMPDYVVLFSTLGGIAVFGLSGFVIGPVIAALFIAVWHLFVAQNTATVSDPD